MILTTGLIYSDDGPQGPNDDSGAAIDNGYNGIVYFNDDCAELIVPIRDNLFININDSFARSNCANCVDNT